MTRDVVSDVEESKESHETPSFYDSMHAAVQSRSPLVASWMEFVRRGLVFVQACSPKTNDIEKMIEEMHAFSTTILTDLWSDPQRRAPEDAGAEDPWEAQGRFGGHYKYGPEWEYWLRVSTFRDNCERGVCAVIREGEQTYTAVLDQTEKSGVQLRKVLAVNHHTMPNRMEFPNTNLSDPTFRKHLYNFLWEIRGTLKTFAEIVQTTDERISRFSVLTNDDFGEESSC